MHTNMQALVGRTLRGTYFLNRYIAEGNFGALYESEQRFLGVPVRRVAVKVSKEANIDPMQARDIFADIFLLTRAIDEMTKAEVRIHLVHVYDAGLLDEGERRAFVVMEFIQGETLRSQFLKYKRVPGNQLLVWARQICRALAGLHALPDPVLHRDLKPENVLLGVDNLVRLVDFGLAAKMLHYGYAPGIAGTLAYMAPETMVQEGRSYPASDVFSVGILLYEGLTGERPFPDPPADLPAALHQEWAHRQRASLRVLPPSLWNSSVEPWLDQIILRCLRFDWTQRYQDAGALLQALSEPVTVPCDRAGLEEGRELRARGRLHDARDALRAGLACDSTGANSDIRFYLQSELGDVMNLLDDPREAASYYEQAWKTNVDSVTLRETKDKDDFLRKMELAYRRSGNSWKADETAHLRSHLPQRGKV